MRRWFGRGRRGVGCVPRQAALELVQEGPMDRTPPPRVADVVERTIGTVHAIIGQLDQAEEDLKRTFTISRMVGDAARQATSLVFAGFLKNWQGEFGEVMRLEPGGQQIAREHNLLIELLRSLFVGGIVLVGQGDYEQARTTRAWTSPRIPPHGRISSKAGGCGARSLSLADGGTKRSAGCVRPCRWRRRSVTRHSSGRPISP